MLTPASRETIPQEQNRPPTAVVVDVEEAIISEAPPNPIDQSFHVTPARHRPMSEETVSNDSEHPRSTTMSYVDGLAPSGALANDDPPALDYPDALAWQIEALDAWRRHGRRGVVETLTGAGKTGLGVMATAEAVRQGVKVLFIVPTARLQSKWIEALNLHLPNVRVGEIRNAGHESADSVDVFVTVVGAIELRQNVRSLRAGLIIADECDHYAASTSAAAGQDDESNWRLRLTPIYEEAVTSVQKQLDSTILDGIVYSLSFDRALKDGVIAPFDVALVGVDLTHDEAQRYGVLSDDMRNLSR